MTIYLIVWKSGLVLLNVSKEFMCAFYSIQKGLTVPKEKSLRAGIWNRRLELVILSKFPELVLAQTKL